MTPPLEEKRQERFELFRCPDCGRIYTDSLPCAGDGSWPGVEHPEIPVERIEVVPASALTGLREAGHGLLILAKGFRDLARLKEIAPLDRVLIQQAIDKWEARAALLDHAENR